MFFKTDYEKPTLILISDFQESIEVTFLSMNQPKRRTKTTKKTKKEQPKTFFGVFMNTVWKFFKFAIPGLFLFGVAVVIFVIASSEPIDTENIGLDVNSSICYLDENGELGEYEKVSGTQNRFWVEYTKVPQQMKDAFVSIEDERFFSHNGFDIKRTFRAVLDYLTEGSGAQGGSTITQQLVKNITNNQDRTPVRKIQEIWLAYQLEQDLTKEQILELYMNTIYLAQGVNGVQTASRLYFDKDVSELTLAECASIAGITQYPTYYDPFLNPDNNKKKQEVVLRKMLELEKITQEEHDQAVAETLNFKKGNMKTSASNQSYMTEVIIEDAVKLLMEAEGLSETMATKKIVSGGYQIISTVDPKVQRSIEQVFSDPANFPKSPYNEHPQGAIVVMDPQTGHIKGMYGGIGPKPGAYSLNRAVDSYRQPGSCMKPIGVYAPALEAGIIKPMDVYTDKAVTYGSWSPKNYYSGFKGRMSVQRAVELSVNTIPVQILEKLGVEQSYRMLRDDFHITSLQESDKVLGALALGGLTKGISVLEITAAYASFANNGVYTEPTTVLEIRDSHGRTVVTVAPKSHIAISERTAEQMHQMLLAVAQNGTGTAARISGTKVAGKTGTTDNDIDRWFVGYTPNYVAAVWYGFDTPKSMAYVSGNPALNAWKKVMDPIMQSAPRREYATKTPAVIPSSSISVEVCSVTKLLPSEFCINSGTVVTESLLDGAPYETCTEELHLAAEVPEGTVGAEGETNSDTTDASANTEAQEIAPAA